MEKEKPDTTPKLQHNNLFWSNINNFQETPEKHQIISTCLSPYWNFKPLLYVTTCRCLAALACIHVRIQVTREYMTEIIAAVMPTPASTQPPATLNLSTIGFTDVSNALKATRNAILVWPVRNIWMTVFDVVKIIKSLWLVDILRMSLHLVSKNRHTVIMDEYLEDREPESWVPLEPRLWHQKVGSRLAGNHLSVWSCLWWSRRQPNLSPEGMLSVLDCYWTRNKISCCTHQRLQCRVSMLSTEPLSLLLYPFSCSAIHNMVFQCATQSAHMENESSKNGAWSFHHVPFRSSHISLHLDGKECGSHPPSTEL